MRECAGAGKVGRLCCVDGCLLVNSTCGKSNNLEKGAKVHTVPT
jgi:hypothetical protein